MFALSTTIELVYLLAKVTVVFAVTRRDVIGIGIEWLH